MRQNIQKKENGPTNMRPTALEAVNGELNLQNHQQGLCFARIPVDRNQTNLLFSNQLTSTQKPSILVWESAVLQASSTDALHLSCGSVVEMHQ
jgi:hypothetical protein